MLLVCLASLIICLHAGSRSRDLPEPIYRLIDPIQCDVCRLVSEHAFALFVEGPLAEDVIQESVEAMCDPDSEDGEWIVFRDIVRIGRKLVLQDMALPGLCGRECFTIRRACDTILESNDIFFASHIYKQRMSPDGLTFDGLFDFLCIKQTASCRPDRLRRLLSIPLPPDAGSEAFQPISEQQRSAQKLAAKLSRMPGAPAMDVYSADDSESYLADLREEARLAGLTDEDIANIEEFAAKEARASE